MEDDRANAVTNLLWCMFLWPVLLGGRMAKK